ncbi:MAG: hypothetical protein PHV74_10615 [Dehalococcoidia bacterium]|nr:hypothetical protein [Dehalococcoidia bacterium]
MVIKALSMGAAAHFAYGREENMEDEAKSVTEEVVANPDDTESRGISLAPTKLPVRMIYFSSQSDTPCHRGNRRFCREKKAGLQRELSMAFLQKGSALVLKLILGCDRLKLRLFDLR